VGLLVIPVGAEKTTGALSVRMMIHN